MGFKGLAGLVLLTAFLPLAATAATITVQSGETLSEIADRYGVSTRPASYTHLTLPTT